jgi:hypothetical protein
VPQNLFGDLNDGLGSSLSVELPPHPPRR